MGAKTGLREHRLTNQRLAKTEAAFSDLVTDCVPALSPDYQGHSSEGVCRAYEPESSQKQNHSLHFHTGNTALRHRLRSGYWIG